MEAVHDITNKSGKAQEAVVPKMRLGAGADPQDRPDVLVPGMSSRVGIPMSSYGDLDRKIRDIEFQRAEDEIQASGFEQFIVGVVVCVSIVIMGFMMVLALNYFESFFRQPH